MLGDGIRFKVKRDKSDLSSILTDDGSVSIAMSPSDRSYRPSSVWKDDAQMAVIAPWARSFERIGPAKTHREGDLEMV
ncbi:hypothetical protein BG004_005487 [Podila humilis]|nr:hypothetical protein BG004_005487 [Podila humilis]